MDVIRVSIGTEPSQFVAGQVLKSSILRRTSRPVEFLESWTEEAGWHPLFKAAPAVKQGTKFSTWRWLVPAAYGKAGRAIYLDADQVVLGDIAELWGSLPDDKTAAMVRNAVGVFGKKTPEPDHWQTSVMVLDCDVSRWHAHDLFRRVNDGEMAYRDMMQATWIPDSELHEIDPAWNVFGVCPPGTKLIHFSHVASQPWKNPDHPIAHIWWHELREAINSRHLKMSDIEHAVRENHIHPKYIKRLEKTCA